MRGRVKWVDEIKGFGVITPDRGENSFYFFCDSGESEECKDIRAGDEVEFETVPEEKLPEARKIHKVGATAKE